MPSNEADDCMDRFDLERAADDLPGVVITTAGMPSFFLGGAPCERRRRVRLPRQNRA